MIHKYYFIDYIYDFKNDKNNFNHSLGRFKINNFKEKNTKTNLNEKDIINNENQKNYHLLLLSNYIIFY